MIPRSEYKRIRLAVIQFQSTMRKSLSLFAVFSLLNAFGQTIDPIQLDDEISKLNDGHDFEKSILRLEEIINEPRSTAYDRFHAHIQKALTYKRLYNYTRAMHNLDLAMAESNDAGDRKLEIETRVLVEKMFIYFDLQKQDEFEALLKQLKEENLKYIGRETKAFYISVLGIMSLRKKDYEDAERRLNEAIAILEKENPRHLPNIYRVKVALYGELQDHNKVMEAYETGLSYANEYEVDIYRIIMYETITKYYSSKKDYKNAFDFQQKVSAERTKYNAHNVMGNLTVLEMSLYEQRKGLELKQEKTLQYYLATIAIMLSVLIFVLWKLLLANRQKRKLVEKENDRIRSVIEQLTKEQDSKGLAKVNLDGYGLSERQLQIINLVKQGKSNKQIGAELFISENTVKYHLKTIYDTLGIESRTELKINFV